MRAILEDPADGRRGSRISRRVAARRQGAARVEGAWGKRLARRPREPGCVKSPSFNLRVEHLSQFHAYGKPIPLVTSARRWQLRKQFCASLAHATFHTACFSLTTPTQTSSTPVPYASPI